MENGNAAPMEKRKKGNTRSTHVMPGRSGRNIWSGGGTWAWYIQAGRMPKTSMEDSTISIMASPLSASKDSALFIDVQV